MSLLVRRFAALAIIALIGAVAWRVKRPNGPRHGASRVEVVAVARTAAGERSVDRRESPPRVIPPSAPALFTLEHPANADALDRALRAPARRVAYVRIDRALVTSKQSPFWQKPGEGRVELPLAGGGALSVVIGETTSLGPDRFTSTGHLAGRPDSRVVFAWNEGFLHASVFDVELGKFALRTATDELAQIYQVDEGLVPACGGMPVPVLDADAIAALVRARASDSRTSGAAISSEPTVAAAAATGVTVDVMMLYTQGVLTTVAAAQRPAAVQSAFDAAIVQVNSDLAASGITARVRLVSVAAVNYPGDELNTFSAGWQSNALDTVRQTADGKLDEIHALRDASGADLVCLVLNRPDSTSSGLAYVLSGPGDTSNPLFGFSVVQYSFIAATGVVSHELGHGFGCAHDRQNASSPGAYSYSYGYRFTGRNGSTYRTIMAYDPGTRLAFFSNPNVTAPSPVSVPLGIAAGQAGEADNARTIEQDAFEVASFRLQTQSAFANGTLINVSTRALVGAGERQLIGGFVIGGTAAKTMLLRAAGPGLAQFGVSNALADPRLTVIRNDGSGATVAANDNWSEQASATDVAAATAQVSPFAFASGSKDAALLVSLAPGAYTVNIEGASGTTGVALVEAYEVERNATRVSNLSTRGYADNATPMFGGFVVSGTAGETKRILIRALGPTLTRFGLATPMNDPVLEIYDSSGRLILKNDDWATATLQTNGTTDDFQPGVKTYGQQQIFATGYGPANRREPCVLVDLLPGNYSAIVKPFEQPPLLAGQGGVTIVEVYEIGVR